MAYSMISTNYVCNFESFCSEADNNTCDQQSSWDLYVEDFIANQYDHMQESSFSSDATKTMEAFIDHELEDTATSPVHSPKVNEMSSLLMMKSSKGDTIDVYKGNGQTLAKAGDDMIGQGLLETELRKKGLCLVPMSMAVNYLGCNNI